MIVAKFANEVYARWTMSTGELCPESLSDLKEFTNRKDTKDPWGNELVMLCGEDAPPDGSGFAVFSKGADGVGWTEDDVRSW